MRVVQESIALGLPGCHLPIYSPTSCFGEKWRYVRSILQKAPVGLTARLLLDAFLSSSDGAHGLLVGEV